MGIEIVIQSPTVQEMSATMLDAVANELGKAFRFAASGIRLRVGRVATEAIKSSPEYTSLLTGQLRGELGVVNAEPILLTICRNIADGVVVTSLGARRTGMKIEGGIRIELLKGDYSEALSVAGASFVSEHGFSVDWLRWLTLEGDRIIIADFSYVSGFPQRSRTGLGIMKRPGTWSVPAEFSGTDSDNFLTRALESIGPEIEVILQQEIQKALR